MAKENPTSSFFLDDPDPDTGEILINPEYIQPRMEVNIPTEAVKPVIPGWVLKGASPQQRQRIIANAKNPPEDWHDKY